MIDENLEGKNTFTLLINRPRDVLVPQKLKGETMRNVERVMETNVG